MITLHHFLIPHQYPISLVLLGAGLIFLSFIGPTHMMKSDLSLPPAIKSSIHLVGIMLPLIGLNFLIIGCFPYPMLSSICLFIVSTLLMLMGCFAFLRIGFSLPNDLYINEILSIIKGVHHSERGIEPLVENTYAKWTSGEAGLPVNTTAPNGEIISLDSTSHDLLGYLNQEAPHAYWVLNFGSYTCPHYRQKIDELNQISVEWAVRGVRFLTIYTAEAHPEDGWRLDKQYLYDKEYNGKPKDFIFYQAKVLNQRLFMAHWLKEKKGLNMPIVLDNMQNTLLKDYNTWPVRLYIIKKSRIVYTGGQGPFGYHPKNLSTALKQLLNSD